MSRSKTAFPNIGNLEVLNAVLYIWAKKGVLHLQQLGNIQVQVNEVSLDSTCIKVHPDGMGALKKGATVHRENTRRMEYQTSYGRRI